MINKDFVATVLMEAVYTNDERVMRRYSIAERTLRSYRERLRKDPELAALFGQKNKEFSNHWIEEMGKSLYKAMITIGECADAIGRSEKAKVNPQLIEALTKAISVCADFKLTSDELTYRRTPKDRSPDVIFGQPSPEGNDDRPN